MRSVVQEMCTRQFDSAGAYVSMCLCSIDLVSYVVVVLVGCREVGGRERV